MHTHIVGKAGTVWKKTSVPTWFATEWVLQLFWNTYVSYYEKFLQMLLFIKIIFTTVFSPEHPLAVAAIYPHL